ncbi:MAG: response regulator [Bacteroidota bacterium]
MTNPPFVLLADDDEDDRSIFTEILFKINKLINVETVEDGAQLLEKLSQLIIFPDLLFLDLNMPCLTGHECLTDIRKQKTLDQLPVIIFSTSGRTEDINSTYSKGANLYLKKPNAFHRMEILLRKVLALDWRNYFPSPPKNLYYIE